MIEHLSEVFRIVYADGRIVCSHLDGPAAAAELGESSAGTSWEITEIARDTTGTVVYPTREPDF